MSLDVYLGKDLYDANITHNLGRMADKAGLYDAVWRPDEHGITIARQLIPVLEKGIADMESRPDYFKQFDSPNGWGLYEHFLPWLKNYLSACKAHPRAKVRVSR